jgi:C4-type Zn-finger protein
MKFESTRDCPVCGRVMECVIHDTSTGETTFTRTKDSAGSHCKNCGYSWGD